MLKQRMDGGELTVYDDDVCRSSGIVLRRKSLHKEGRRWATEKMVAVFNVSYVDGG